VAQRFGGRSIPQLSGEDLDGLLTYIEKREVNSPAFNGNKIFDLIFSNTMEGFFGDPIYGGNRDSQHLAGGPLQGWFAASLTSDERTGLGAWSKDEIVEYLRTGRNARSAASGPMAEVVEYSTALMTEPDLRAIATEMGEPASQVAAPPGRAPLAAEDARMKIGEAIYLDRCMACHTRSGEGVPNMFPRLAGSQVVQQEGSETVLRVVLQGVRAAYTPHAPTSPAMPAFGWRLNDDQAAAVTTYIRNAWGNAAPAVAWADAARMRGLLRDRP
jgi:mono/diheme cytochrome c family protein